MKKVLIVAKDGAIRDLLRLVCEKMNFEGIATDHAEALNAFLSEEPTAVVICDYEERCDKKEFKGAETFKDIKNSATNEIVLRLGFSKFDYADYLQMPFDLKELEKKLSR